MASEAPFDSKCSSAPGRKTTRGTANKRVEDTQNEILFSLDTADRSLARGVVGPGEGADDGAADDDGERQRGRAGGAGPGDGPAWGHDPGLERAGGFGPEQ